MYYRLFAARYLPTEIDRVLYLDPDIVVNGNLQELYDTPLNGYLFAAATHVREIMRKINVLRLGMHEDGTYINSGVLLMNLKLLREEQDYQKVFKYIKKYNKGQACLYFGSSFFTLFITHLLKLYENSRN